jgi:flavin reductase (DIM6/NTAB) family NADH-FMN oxidoreductase RutF
MILFNKLRCRVQSTDGVNEFIKSGVTPVPSDLVKPFRVQESPVQFECKVTQIIALGEVEQGT